MFLKFMLTLVQFNSMENDDLLLFIYFMTLRSIVHLQGICTQYDGSLDPLKNISFRPVLHNWCNKNHGMECISQSVG